MALTPWASIVSALKGGPQQFGLYMKGIGTDTWYAVEVDATTGAIPVSFSGSISLNVDKDWGVVGVNTLRTAAIVGNEVGLADFDEGNSSAQTLRVVVASDQPPIDVNFTPAVVNFGDPATAQRVAAVLGNETDTADFGSGTVSGQTLRVVLPTDQPPVDVEISAPVEITGTVDVDVVASVLPTGAATESTLASIDSALAGTLDVSVSASVLPTGAATESTLAAASAKLPATLGQKAMADSLAVAIASDQSAIPVTSTPGTLDFGNSNAAGRTAAQIGNATGAADFNTGAAGAQTLRTVLAARSEAAATPLSSRLSDGSAFYNTNTAAQLPAALGQTTMSASLPVVMASDQVTPAAAGMQATLVSRDYASTSATTAYSDLNATGGTTLGANTYKAISVFETGGGSTGLGYILGWGGVDKLYIPAGGFDCVIPLTIPASTQLRIKTVAGTVSTGVLYMNCFF